MDIKRSLIHILCSAENGALSPLSFVKGGLIITSRSVIALSTFCVSLITGAMDRISNFKRRIRWYVSVVSAESD